MIAGAASSRYGSVVLAGAATAVVMLLLSSVFSDNSGIYREPAVSAAQPPRLQGTVGVEPSADKGEPPPAHCAVPRAVLRAVVPVPLA